MPEKGIRSTYSQSPFQILMYDDQGMLSTGTGFFYELRDELFLITNWHNFSGRHFLTKDPLSPQKRFPLFIQTKLSTYIDKERRQFTAIAHRIEIYTNYSPCWYEHPEMGSDCDVVALPIKRPGDCADNMHNAANKIARIKIPVLPGNSVFVIGFPKSISVGFGLPLWKSGYIASEPHYDITIGGSISPVGGLQNGRNIPAFFIDTQTREGMSGSPVFASYIGSWDSSNPYTGINPDAPDFWDRDDVILGDNRMEFIGCYSGRIGATEEGAALGLCWREDVIVKICESKKVAKHPHIF
ncbi:serine protease [Parachryseolinea silvisoli]|uniref:serine protease n=1 Tax=Parachryseolinea silvisoli TaxID=2873601 RepID=UPI002265D240|nr:serine protease [Parachryseolinea silvisoli]MCD9015479.1 serine protease [Parachryseolinea silvisoli]